MGLQTEPQVRIPFERRGHELVDRMRGGRVELTQERSSLRFRVRTYFHWYASDRFIWY
jgi:hypothetical protein